MELTELRETAELARLNLSEEELEKAFPAFEQMLSYFAAMQAADTDNSLPAAAAQTEGRAASAKIVAAGYFRPDNARSLSETNLCESLLEQAPERDGRFMVIPNVL